MTQKEKIWGQLLAFVIVEFFGNDVTNHIPLPGKGVHLDEIAEGETLCDVELEEHEKRFYEYVGAVCTYLTKNHRKIPSGDLSEKRRAAHALSDLFWAFVKLNHPDLQDHESIGIRKNYRIVQSSGKSHNLLMELIEAMYPNK